MMNSPLSRGIIHQTCRRNGWHLEIPARREDIDKRWMLPPPRLPGAILVQPRNYPAAGLTASETESEKLLTESWITQGRA